MRLAADRDLELRHVDGGGRGLGNFDLLGIVQEGFGDPSDFGRHGRGEEQRLPGERDQLADAFDVRDEAHVEHAVGFVDHQHFDAGEQQAPRSKWSSRRPGVAISTSTPRVNLVSWSPNETPPISSATLRF